jgi:hypothetical protein
MTLAPTSPQHYPRNQTAHRADGYGKAGFQERQRPHPRHHEKEQVNDRLPRYLENVRIAHKTGDGQPFIANDAGVLWVNGEPIVLVVFSGHHRGTTVSMHDNVARIAAFVVRHYGGQVSPEFTNGGNH